MSLPPKTKSGNLTYFVFQKYKLRITIYKNTDLLVTGNLPDLKVIWLNVCHHSTNSVVFSRTLTSISECLSVRLTSNNRVRVSRVPQSLWRLNYGLDDRRIGIRFRSDVIMPKQDMGPIQPPAERGTDGYIPGAKETGV